MTEMVSPQNTINMPYYVDEVTEEIVKIINQIFHDLDVPQSLRNGILTPVLKKKKDKTIPGNYRGIVVTNIFSKFFETIVKDRLETDITITQSLTAWIYRRCLKHFCCVYNNRNHFVISLILKVYLELVALDAEKAFDTVNHEIMLNKLFHDGIDGDMWTLLRNVYKDLTLKIKKSINVSKGIRQGEKLSSLLYKRYNNTILNAITNSNLGAHIESIQVASPICADDIALLGEWTDIQAMLNVIEHHTKRDMVKINPDKSEVICVSKGKNDQSNLYTFGGKEITRVSNLKHLGITRTTNGKVNLEERLKTGRQTIYALLGSGLHARVGMSPIVLQKIWKTYVVPKYLYGLEVQICSKDDIVELEKLQRKTLKHFQCLPERTASAAVYILLGTEPIEIIIDRNMLSLFLTISRLENSIERKILEWELDIGPDFDTSFIARIKKNLK
jgi:hypothetical protein